MKSHWLVLWSLWAARMVRQPTLPVRVTGGWLRGVIAPDGSHKRYLAIQYASHPAKRFMDPDREPTWRGVFEAVEENVHCIQRIGTNIVIGQEECLILNVYTPLDSKPDSKYPVMVFIHGGGYFGGSSTSLIYGPDYLVSKGVILVVMNYRLTVQGFTCLKIKEAPGNAGSKDQVAALKWVQRNIEAFGGNHHSVTLFGSSAGAASVSLHLLSPMSRNLFHRGIMQSGSSLATWSLQFRPVYIANLVTKTMLYATEDVYEVYNILMAKSDRDLVVTRVPRREGDAVLSELIHAPCVEDNIPGVEPFLTDTPFNLFSKGEYQKVPMLIGYNNADGLYLVNFENVTTIPKIKLEKSFPKNLRLTEEPVRREIAKKLKEVYFDGKDVSYYNLANLSRWYSDLYIITPMLEEVEFHLKTNDNPVHTYVFAYVGRRNIAKFVSDFGLHKEPGASHADELFYMFRQPLIPTFFDYNMIERLTTMWTNFAKYGDPTPVVSHLLPVKWLPTNKSSPHSLIIDREFSTSPLWNSDSLKYLRDIYAKYRRLQD